MVSSLDSSGLYTSTVHSGPLWLNLCQCKTPASPSPSRLLSPFRPLCIPLLCILTTPSHAPGYLSLHHLLPLPPDSLRVLQWNAGGLRARSTELLHFLSSYSVDLICIQKSNLYSSSSFRIPGFSVLRSDCTHSQFGILSPNTARVGGGAIIFVKQGLSSSELSVSYLFLLDPYSDYIGANISLNNSSPLSFL